MFKQTFIDFSFGTFTFSTSAKHGATLEKLDWLSQVARQFLIEEEEEEEEDST